jgi:hypothetical protein
MTDFYVAVKSTVDKLAVDIAASLAIDFVDDRGFSELRFGRHHCWDQSIYQQG